ncbi:uncharacterized protein LOC115628204 [Scaptodrosophila lebanonensis]|uniref:Uncharacterized protein LOC115628204 n=1 Tax=Drosophila lebanonensis TaxID=7225 RepID=A0A6J2TYV4_DROLE|nr:uncharacterized protein LOC115628204 [Scaptodrosophila lebanonensis]
MINSSTVSITMLLVRTKLRKSEESLGSSPNITAQQQYPLYNSFGEFMSDQQQSMPPEEMDNNKGGAIKDSQHITFVRASRIETWTFPPKAPIPHIYKNISPDLLMASSDRNGFKGFRKQFSGRFKRLVNKKPDPEPVIPPELKSQLKTIYVY